jgi:phosphatidylglycerol:prolipoprotein diacylglycerol transferase
MLPYLHLGWFNLPTFGLMLWCAAVAGALVVDRAFKRENITADAVGMVAIALVAGIVGAKLWHVFDSPSEFRTIGWGVLWDTAGFAWYGGMVFGLLALVLQGLREKIGALRTLDLCAPAAAIGYGIGRIGCFLSGDGCYASRHRPGSGSGLSDSALRAGSRAADRMVFMVAAGQAARHGRHSGPISCVEWHSSLSG